MLSSPPTQRIMDDFSDCEAAAIEDVGDWITSSVNRQLFHFGKGSISEKALSPSDGVALAAQVSQVQRSALKSAKMIQVCCKNRVFCFLTKSLLLIPLFPKWPAVLQFKRSILLSWCPIVRSGWHLVASKLQSAGSQDSYFTRVCFHKIVVWVAFTEFSIMLL